MKFAIHNYEELKKIQKENISCKYITKSGTHDYEKRKQKLQIKLIFYVCICVFVRGSDRERSRGAGPAQRPPSWAPKHGIYKSL